MGHGVFCVLAYINQQCTAHSYIYLYSQSVRISLILKLGPLIGPWMFVLILPWVEMTKFIIVIFYRSWDRRRASKHASPRENLDSLMCGVVASVLCTLDVLTRRRRLRRLINWRDSKRRKSMRLNYVDYWVDSFVSAPQDRERMREFPTVRTWKTHHAHRTYYRNHHQTVTDCHTEKPRIKGQVYMR